MCPELCARRLLISPVTHTVPTRSSIKRRTVFVTSVTEKTRRISAAGNKSPLKSHCDFTFPGMLRLSGFNQRLRDSLNALGLSALVINLDDHALQHYPTFRHVESLRHVRQETFDDRLDLAAQNAFVSASESCVAKECCAAREDLFVCRLH